MSDSQSLSDISVSSQSKASISDLGAAFQSSVKNGLKTLKRQVRPNAQFSALFWHWFVEQNKKAKKVVIKFVPTYLRSQHTLTLWFRGTEHKSSTVAEHTEIVSVQLQDANGGYLGSAHIDANGTVYPNKNWEKNVGKWWV
jgi:hypothetical protein